MNRLIENLNAQITENGKAIIYIYPNRDYNAPNEVHVDSVDEGIGVIEDITEYDDIRIPHPNAL